MAITVEQQRKYKFEASVVTATRSYQLFLDGFTPPDRRAEPVKRIIGGKEYSLTGPISYGEASIKFTLKISDSVTDYASLIADLESLIDSDSDSFDCSVYLKSSIGGTNAANSYQLDMSACRVLGIKFDDLDSRGDDDLVHIMITFQPGSVDRLQGQQMPA